MVELAVEELGLDFVDLGGVEANRRSCKCDRDGAAEQVPQLALVEGLALARLDEIALDHDVGIAVQLDLQALAEFAGVVAGHDCSSRFAFCGGLVMVEFAVMARCIFYADLRIEQTCFACRGRLAIGPGRFGPQPGRICRLLGLDPALAAEAERRPAASRSWRRGRTLARIHPATRPTRCCCRSCRGRPKRPQPPVTGRSARRGRRLCGPGLLRKYHGRILMVTTGRAPSIAASASGGTFPTEDNAWMCRLGGLAVRKIADDRSIEEVILSGGDPLMLPDAALARLADELAEIPHLRRLRIHTRLPVMIPQRVTDELSPGCAGVGFQPSWWSM